MENKFNINDFNENFKSSEKLAIDYIYNTIIKYIPKSFNEFTNNKTEIRNHYLLNLWYSVNSLNDCLWLYESYSFKNEFDFDTYAIVRDKLFNELGLICNENTGEWKQMERND